MGTGELMERGCDGPKQFGAVVGLVGFEHALESVEELPPDGDQRLPFEFATLEQLLVESAQVGVVLHGDQGGQVEGATQVFIAGLADARFFLHRRSRGVLTRVEPGVSHPLTSR